MVLADRASVFANYKGIAIVDNGAALRILAPDFFNARIDIFDENFNLVSSPSLPMFVNPAMPAGYAPFNVVALGDKVYVTYGKQDADKADDLHGAGLGMLDEFDVNGNFVRTIMPVGQLLDGPWGIARAPIDFCKSTANALLVGNFGDGHITAFDADSGRLIGQLANDKGGVLAIEGLWALAFGDQKTAGESAHLYFTAGPGDEKHGLFGYLASNEQK